MSDPASPSLPHRLPLLGWSAAARLVPVAAALALLWLAVGWALR